MSSLRTGMNSRVFLYIGFLVILIALPIFISIISTKTQYRGRASTTNLCVTPEVNSSNTTCPQTGPNLTPPPGCQSGNLNPEAGGCQCGYFICPGSPTPTPNPLSTTATTTPTGSITPDPTDTPPVTPTGTLTVTPTSAPTVTPGVCAPPSPVTNVAFSCPSCSSSFATPTESPTGPTDTPSASGGNFISNPSFENNKDSWGFRDPTGGSSFNIDSTGANSTNHSAKINVAEASPNTYNVQLYQTFAIPPAAGKIYTLTFYAKADTWPWTISICIQDSSGTNSNSTGCQNVSLQNTSSWQKYTLTFNYKGDSEIDFNVGAIKGNVWLDEISFE